MLKYKIIFGDAEEVLKDMDDNSVGLIVTSPPYYQMRDVMKYRSYSDFLDKMEKIFRELYRVLKVGRVFALNVSDEYIYKGKDYDVGMDLYYIAKNQCNFRDEEKIIWAKPTGMNTGASKRFGNFIKNPYPFYYKPNRIFEFIFILTKGKMTRITMGQRSKKSEASRVEGDMKKFNSNVWKIGTSSQDNPWDHKLDDSAHTAMFPEVLPDNIIKLYSLKEDVVLDPFLGSGTTMVAAKNNERSCIGIEIDEGLLPLLKVKTHWMQKNLRDDVEYEIIKYEEK